jgi:hypothetical protein
MKRFWFNPLKGVLLLQVSDIPGVVHMVEYHDMGDSIWIVLERGDHTKVNHISKKVTKFKTKYISWASMLYKRSHMQMEAFWKKKIVAIIGNWFRYMGQAVIFLSLGPVWSDRARGTLGGGESQEGLPTSRRCSLSVPLPRSLSQV